MPVNIIDTLKPKNGLSFPIVEAIDVFVENYGNLADAISHFATDAMIAAINEVLSGKANTSDVNTATASLQAQIDQIAQTAGTGTADTEIGQARVASDSTSHTTLNDRITYEVSEINGDLEFAGVKSRKADVEFSNGYYKSSDVSYSTDSNFRTSSRIALAKGESIYVTAKGYLTAMMIVAVVNENNVCVSDGTRYGVQSRGNNVETYIYTAPKDVYVRISGVYTEPILHKIGYNVRTELAKKLNTADVVNEVNSSTFPVQSNAVKTEVDKLNERITSMKKLDVVDLSSKYVDGFIYWDGSFHDTDFKCVELTQEEFYKYDKLYASGKIRGINPQGPLYATYDGSGNLITIYDLDPSGTVYTDKEIAITDSDFSIVRINLGSDYNEFIFKSYVVDTGDKGSNEGDVIVNFGDSLFGNWHDGSSISAILAKKTGATVYNCGLGGTTMARWYEAYSPNPQGYSDFALVTLVDSIASGDYSIQDDWLENHPANFPAYFSDTIALMKSIDFSKVDIVTISLATNDFGTDVVLDNPNNPTSKFAFNYAMKYSIETLLNAYPNIRIVICTPMWRGNAKTPNGQSLVLSDYADAIKTYAHDNNIFVCDYYYEMSVNALNQFSMFGNSSDTVHPNAYGRRRMANKLSMKIAEM